MHDNAVLLFIGCLLVLVVAVAWGFRTPTKESYASTKCQSGYTIFKGTCVPKKGHDGEECNTDTDDPFIKGNRGCHGVCLFGKCHPKKINVSGGSCYPGKIKCGDGLVCYPKLDPVSFKPGWAKCYPSPAKLGEACITRSSLGAVECGKKGDDLYCDDRSGTKFGVCKQKPFIGEACIRGKVPCVDKVVGGKKVKTKCVDGICRRNPAEEGEFCRKGNVIKCREKGVYCESGVCVRK